MARVHFPASIMLVSIAILGAMLITAPASAVIWLSPSNIYYGPVVQNGSGPFGILPVPGTSGPTLQDLSDGFRFTDVRFEYVTVGADIGKTLTLTWSADRSLWNPAASPWQNKSDIDGQMDFTAGINVNSITLLTTTTDTDAFYAKALVPGATIVSGVPFAATDTGALTVQPNGNDRLLQVFLMDFVVTGVGDSFRLDLPGSAASTAITVPEPPVLGLFGGLVLAAGAWIARRRRSVV